MKKTMLKWIGAFAMVWCAGSSVVAQQDAMFSQYMFNTLAVNSGYAGSRDALTVTALSRHQWVGLAGAPTTQTLTMHTPIINPSLGMGLSLVHDVIGPVKNTSFFADFAYRMQVGRDAKLAFGLKGGGSLFQAALTPLVAIDGGDAGIQNIQSSFLPNVGFGMYYNAPRYYLGLSVPKLLENDMISSATTRATEQRHYYFIAGAVFDLNRTLKFKPTMLTKVVFGSPVQFDFSGLFLLREKFWVGPSFRTGESVGLVLQYQFNDQFRAGYAYDFPINKLRSVHSGSHEIMISYDFEFGNAGRIKSPRYF